MLSKINRLKGTAKFKDIFKRGEKYFSSFFVVYKLGFDEEREPLIGFIASKKVGGAVERNKAKRLISEAVRANLKSQRTTCDFVFILKKNIMDQKLEVISKEISRYW